MPVNTVKDLSERLKTAQTELRSAHEAYQADAANTELRDAFDLKAAAVEGLKAQLETHKRAETLLAYQAAVADEPDGILPEERNDPAVNPDPTKYNILRAMNRFLDTGGKVDGYEGEVHQAIESRMSELGHPVNPRGILIPLNLRMSGNVERRAADFTADGAVGGKLIQTDVPRTVIEVLRNRLVLRRCGTRVVAGLVGNVDIPKKTSATTFAWAAADAAAASSNPVIDQVQLRPETVSGWTEITRRLMKQTQSSDAQNLVMMDLIESLAQALDTAGIKGTGSSNQPEGLTINSSVNSVAGGTNGLAPTWANIVAMESAIAADNADVDTMCYLFNAVTRGKMKTVEKAANTAKFLWGDDNTVNGYRAEVTNILPSNLTKGAASGVCSAALFGDFSQLIMALWGTADVMVDPYSASTKGNVRVIVHQDANFANRHDESFCKILDILTA